MNTNNIKLFDDKLINYFSSGQRVLEIGAKFGNDKLSHYRKRLINNNIDLSYSYADIRNYDLDDEYGNFVRFDSDNEMDIPDCSFDIVFASNVMEHVSQPWLWIKEIYRVLDFCGLFISLTPISWKHHKDPIDCYRYYPDGAEQILKEGGFCCEECEIYVHGNDTDLYLIGKKENKNND
jgi:SAM-dependent methyltransferase